MDNNNQRMNCILLVDDDAINNFINQKVLKRVNASHKIETASNGEEALQYIIKFCSTTSAHCPQLILLDINMPVMNGLEFLEAFNNIDFVCKSNVKIVILTTSTDRNDINTIKELGFSDIMNKPLTEEKAREILTCF